MVIRIAVIEFLLLIMALPLSYGMSYWIKKRIVADYRDDIRSEFLKEWNGRADDEYYAWVRVRSLYRNRDSQPEQILFIEKQIEQTTRRDMLSGFSVNEKGIIIQNLPSGGSRQITAE